MARRQTRGSQLEPQIGADGTAYFRARHSETGHVITLAVDAYSPDVHELLAENAIDSDGLPLGPRFKGEPEPVEDAPEVEQEQPVA